MLYFPQNSPEDVQHYKTALAALHTSLAQMDGTSISKITESAVEPTEQTQEQKFQAFFEKLQTKKTNNRPAATTQRVSMPPSLPLLKPSVKIPVVLSFAPDCKNSEPHATQVLPVVPSLNVQDRSDGAPVSDTSDIDDFVKQMRFQMWFISQEKQKISQAWHQTQQNDYINHQNNMNLKIAVKKLRAEKHMVIDALTSLTAYFDAKGGHEMNKFKQILMACVQ